MKKAVLALLFTLQLTGVGAQESQTEYNFLRLPVSAHASALGGDNISLIDDDQTLIFHNPALLSSVSDKTVSFNYMNYMQGANMMSVAYNKNIQDRTSIAVSGQFINYGTMKQTTADNVIVGDFSAKDISLAGYFSYMLTDHLAGGVSAKFITSYIGSYHSLAMGIDLGLNYYDPEQDLSLSLVTKNLGGQLKAYNDTYEKMPIDVQLGATKRLTQSPFRFSATVVNLNNWDQKFIHHLVCGMDILLSEQIWVGMGYNFRRANEMSVASSDSESSHGAGFSIGTGVNLDRFKLNLAYGKYHVSSSSVVLNAAFQF